MTKRGNGEGTIVPRADRTFATDLRHCSYWHPRRDHQQEVKS